MAKYINKYATLSDYTADSSARDSLGRTVSLIALDGKMHYDGKMNPLGLSPFTIRCKFKSGYTPTMGDSQTLVDSTENIWDIAKNNNNWSDLFLMNRNLIAVLGANTTGVLYMNNTFNGCSALSSVQLFDTSTVTLMRHMFRACSSLTSVPFFDTSNVTSMKFMFAYCTSLTTVPLFNTSKVSEWMEEMFKNCTSLTNVPLFDTSNVQGMSSMFYGCTSLTSVPLFNTSSCYTMSSMFYGCTSLTSVPLFDTPKVQGMSSMFSGCTSLTSVPLFNTSNAENMTEMFKGCTKVQSGALALYQQASTQTTPPTNYTDCFTNCGSATTTGSAELAQIPSSWGGTKA